MAAVTALLFCYRLPSITPAQFQSYIEDTHVPLVQSLLGSDHPATHTRYYTNKDSPSPSSSSPSSYVMGTPSPDDADLIAVITYASPEAMQRSMAKRRADGIREVLEADEDRFMDRARVKVVVLGEGDIGRTVV